jgi:hypothetical protein
VQRYRSKVVTVPGSSCSWWSGAVSGRGHGRFWLAAVQGRDMVVIAHRFGYGLEHGPEALLSTRVLGHRCDNTLCQRIGAGHVEHPRHYRTGGSGPRVAYLRAIHWVIGAARAAGPGRCATRCERVVSCSRPSRQPVGHPDARCRCGSRTSSAAWLGGRSWSLGPRARRSLPS